MTSIVWHARYTLLGLLHAPHWEAGAAITSKHYTIHYSLYICMTYSAVLCAA
jgi:hypothetical protein